MRKSKRRSTSSGPPDAVFFVDRDLGPRFVETLRVCGLRVEAHEDHFSPEAADEEWLSTVASRNWVILTHDAKIRYTSRAKDSILKSGARVIVLKGKATISDLARNFVRTLPRILTFIRRHPAPFIAKVYRNADAPDTPGRIEMWVDFSS